MSWSYSLALVEEFKQQGCLVTASYARLKEIRTVEKSLWLARKTGQSRPSPSGTMPEPLTASLGVAPLMSSVVDSRVSPSAAQENAKGLKTSATCGLIPSESFARYDPESSSWRTSPDLFGSTSPVFWETWPKQGTIVNGVCWERETSELHTSASGCGSMLPTPTAQTYGSNSGGQNAGPKRHSLQSMARHNLWPTPQAHDATKGNANRVGRYGTKHGGRNLNDWVMKWPTPQARDYKGVPGNNFNMSSLPRAVQRSAIKYGTPTTAQSGRSKEFAGKSCPNPQEVANSLGGSLNPMWVEWLMGWPIGWTGLEPVETGKSPSATPPRGDC